MNTARASYILIGYGNSYITVSDNTLSGGEPGSTIRGIQLGGYGPSPANVNITVSGNTVRSMPLHGIVAESGELANSLITGNHVRGSGTNGIFIDTSNTGNVLTSNVSSANGGNDCRDNSSGSGTAGTANIWLKNIGATRTPEAFLFDAAGKLIYHGTIDDNHASADKVQERYLKDALEALAAGKEIAVKETKAVGCGIKFRPKA